MPIIRSATLAVLVTGLAAADPDPQTGPAVPAGLDPSPLVAEPLGLSMNLPAGAKVTTAVQEVAGLGERIIYHVTDAEGGTWSMRLEAIHAALPEPTAEAMAQQHVRAIEMTGRQFHVLASEPRRVGQLEGRLLYVQQTLEQGNQIVSGWLILPRSARTFMVFSVVTTSDRFLTLGPILDRSFETIEIKTEQEVLTLRESRLLKGRSVIDLLTEQQLRTAISPKRWYRMYQPAVGQGVRSPADDTELGFLSIECLEAPRGALTPERTPDSYGSLEAQLGLMVLIDARAIIDVATDHYLDIQGRYWMSWDRFTEAWSVRMTQRQGQASETSAETGVRDKGTLTVINSTRETLTREPTQWVVPDKAYLCQPEVFVLGTLLPRDGTLTGEMEFYFYDSRTRRLPRRIDRWQPVSQGSKSWELRTQPALDAGSLTQYFDAAGRRLRRVDADGKVTEVIAPQELRRIWKTKGLDQ